MTIDQTLNNFHRRATKILGTEARVSVSLDAEEGTLMKMFHCSASAAWLDGGIMGCGRTVKSALASLQRQIEDVESDGIAL